MKNCLVKGMIAFIFQFLLVSCLVGQNLVSNASFEEHTRYECWSCHKEELKFQKLLLGWQSFNCTPILCDYRLDIKRNDYAVCNPDISPPDGKSILQMEYWGSCKDWDHRTRGCSDYIGPKLENPLQVGKKYKISFQLYIKNTLDSDHPERIGLALFPSKIRNPKGAMFHSRDFKIDTVIFNKWYEVSWNVQPLCEINTVVAGVFKDAFGPQTHTRWHTKVSSI